MVRIRATWTRQPNFFAFLVLGSLIFALGAAAWTSGLRTGFWPNFLLNSSGALIAGMVVLFLIEPVVRGATSWGASVQRERVRLLAQVPQLDQIESGKQAEDDDHQTQSGGQAARFSSERESRYALLLFESQSYGLVLLRRNATASLVLSVLGALVLVGGVISAFVRAWHGGSAAATVVTSTAGVLTTGLGALMHRQANRALKHLEDQSHGLRADLRTDADQRASLATLMEIEDPVLRDRIRAAIALKLAGTDLSVFGDAPISNAQSHNGTLPTQTGR